MLRLANYEAFQLPPFLELVVSKLEAIERGEVKRLILSLPPLLAHFHCDRVRVVRPRASVGHRFVSTAATNPLARPPVTHTGGLRRLAHRPRVFGASP